jgi:hypothetical protein
MQEQFVCERCGQSLPHHRMKELFVWQGKSRARFEVCPACLDKALAEGRTQGMVGLHKRAAVQVTPDEERGVRHPIK